MTNATETKAIETKSAIETNNSTETNNAIETKSAIEIEIPARADYVSLVRLVVAAAAELASGLGPARIDDLRVAVSEATTNAIGAHISSGCTRPVRVCCECSSEQVAVTVVDEGPGFDADALEEMPPVESPERLSRESGMGISIIRMLADEVCFRSASRGTEVSLIIKAP